MSLAQFSFSTSYLPRQIIDSTYWRTRTWIFYYTWSTARNNLDTTAQKYHLHSLTDWFWQNVLALAAHKPKSKPLTYNTPWIFWLVCQVISTEIVYSTLTETQIDLQSQNTPDQKNESLLKPNLREKHKNNSVYRRFSLDYNVLDTLQKNQSLQNECYFH